MSVTLVSCYYSIPSKRSKEKYIEWLDNFFKNIYANMIIFTNKESRKYLEKYKKNNILIIEKEFDEFKIYKEYPNIWNQQYAMDSQKYTGRGIYCYLIWNSKINMVMEAIEKNPFQSDKFIWNDIGNIRKTDLEIDLSIYPRHEKISQNKIDIICINDFNINDFNKKYFKDEIHISGSIFGGSTEAWKTFYKIYYEIMDNYIINNQFIGCDQQLISSCYICQSDLFNLIKPIHFKYDQWFYLYEYYV